jgi:hypothetical protein
MHYLIVVLIIVAAIIAFLAKDFAQGGWSRRWYRQRNERRKP